MSFMQWNACLRAPTGISALVFFALQGGSAHAIPTPPRVVFEEKTANQKVRVLLGALARFSISGYEVAINQNIRFAGTAAFNVRCGNGFVEFGGGRRVSGPLEISSPKGFVKLNDRAYRERLTVISKGTHCVVVNSLDLEKYLAGVISKEMSPSWPLEALKAQAVAARSYALHQMRVYKTRYFDLEGSTQDQVYEGAGTETPRTLEAVEATRGMQLSFGNEALKAYFHANCGGTTEVPGFVWGGEGKAFRPVVCPYHQRHRDRHKWSVLLTFSQIERALKKISGILPGSFRKLASLEAGAPNESRRLTDVALSDTLGNSLLVSTNTFRNAIGNAKLKSTSFHVHRTPQGYEIVGEGHGHGVGMCQVGARAMAEEGHTYQQILRFYYPLAKILRVL